MSSGRVRRLFVLVAVLAAVAVAFADSSIVVLALPDLLFRWHTSIESVSRIVTAYNVAVAVASVGLLVFARRRSPVVLARVGLGLFLVGCVLCGAAWDLWPLVGFRVLQGLGGALLLGSSLPLVRAVAPRRAGALWAGAGLIGAAIGPAAGGLLTQYLDWRSIFFAQAPLAALALLAVMGRLEAEHVEEPRGRRLPALAANAALALLSAALVALLFLAVVLLIDVWGLRPAAAAAVVSAVPVGTLVAQLAGRRLAARPAGAAGILLVVAGLLGLALLPSRSLALAALALALAGAGIGLAAGRLTEVALGAGGASFASFLRHAGLVVGLVVLTPLLTADLSRGADLTRLRVTSVVLDAPLGATEKINLAIKLAPALTDPSSHGLPDFTRQLRHERQQVARLGRHLDGVVKDGVARAFRSSFLVAALFALAALLPLAFALGGLKKQSDTVSLTPAPAPRKRFRASNTVLLASGVALAALAGGELAGGALAYGERPRILPPCADRKTAQPPGFVQQVVLDAIDELACQLGESREQLVIDATKEGSNAADELGFLRDLLGF